MSELNNTGSEEDLYTIVWLDDGGKWRLSQGTSKEKLINWVCVENRRKRYKVFSKINYAQAVEFKQIMSRSRPS